MNRISTDILEIAFEEGGPPDGIPVLLLHDSGALRLL
jgi:hypothetical protein